jgi:hypothetical protein
LHGLLPPRPYALLQRVQLSQAVSPGITGLELNEEFKRRLIRMFFKASCHLLPMVLEDIGTSTTRFVAEPPIRFWPDDNAARAQLERLYSKTTSSRAFTPQE